MLFMYKFLIFIKGSFVFYLRGLSTMRVGLPCLVDTPGRINIKMLILSIDISMSDSIPFVSELSTS